MKEIVFSKMSWSLIRDPIYNYIDFNKDIEKPIIDSTPVQRLRWLRQLQLANMVYPGADHTRFQHSVGVMHLAGLFAEKLAREYKELVGDLEGYSIDALVEIARITGLLHDVGHGPFSHAFEEAIYWSKKLPIPNHEEAGIYIVKYSEIAKVLEEYGILDPVLEILSSKKPGSRVLSLIRNTVKEWVYPADIMDFLLRDSYYAGTREYGIVDYARLIKLSHVNPEDPSSISLEEKALGALAGYLRNRISMFENVYIHPVSSIFSHTVVLMMRRDDELTNYYSEAIEKLSEGEIKPYLELTDYQALVHAKMTAEEHKDEELRILAESAFSRKLLWKLLYEQKILVEPRELAGLTGSLILKKSKEILKELSKNLHDRLLDSILSSDASNFWVSINTLKPIPPVPGGTIQLCRVTDGKVVNTVKMSIPEFLDREGIKLRLIIRVYAPRTIVKEEEKLKTAEKIAKETLMEFITPTGLFTGITM
ncbi:HD domain-containing protein [Desulfurococcaceae archaeon MEX13E-LK6-19]|nr:HD domain-containing protein [Desulfurococcaceae archaeon MEX13E-LK6-19]